MGCVWNMKKILVFYLRMIMNNLGLSSISLCGCVWKWLVPLFTQWFCWSLSLWKMAIMAISLGILTLFSDSFPCFYSPCGGVIPPHLMRHAHPRCRCQCHLATTGTARFELASGVARGALLAGRCSRGATRGRNADREKNGTSMACRKIVCLWHPDQKMGVLMSLDCLELVGMGFHSARS